MRIGILGGTFDPIHIGHLVAASEAHTALKLDKVVFMPAGDPWQKTDRMISDAAHRLAMVERSVANDLRFEVSDLDIRRPGPTYSIDTVLEWQQTHPHDEIFWIVGADALVGISTWHRWQEFVKLAHIVSVDRAFSTAEHTVVEEIPFDYTTVHMPQVRISATQLRSRLAQGVNCQYLMPDTAIDYAITHRLYV
jgi:nicotinate-nucleotide adenylyltransferase